jgi:L-arabinose isomerase
LVEKYNSLFQSIFGLVFQKIGDHTYDFTDRVLTHLSPESMPYLSGMNMVNEARVDFDQLLNNLIASGSADHSAVVQSVLNELLYGWIVEIKREFGAAMESEVVGMAEAVRGLN